MLERLLQNNVAWAARKTEADPEFFKRLVAQQNPPYLWIGCSDSRVPANEIVGLDPGEVFVHRNVANLAPPQDTNYLSVLQYAVEVLKVSTVIVCGHYGCGGVRAAVAGERLGLIDHWLQPVRDVFDDHTDELSAIPHEDQRLDRLCELNVIDQVRHVAQCPFVQEAWARGQKLTVVGWVYALRDGLLRDLHVSVSGLADVAERWPKRASALIGAKRERT